MTIPPISPIVPPIASPAANPAGLDALAGHLGGAADAAANSATNAASGAAGGSAFWQQVQGAMQQMNQLQSSASVQVDQLTAGASGGDVHSAVIAVEKADLAFGMMLQLRNKAVQAYSDISHMSF